MSEKNFNAGRRRFLTQSAAASGLALATTGIAKAKIPCPPLLHSAGAALGCGSGDVEQDWIQRTSGQGVVWSHDFRDKAEVDAFRWSGGYGNDPDDLGTGRNQNTVLHNTDDGLTGGGCLEIVRFAGSRESKDWWRPFSPIAAPYNGKLVDDPGASGSMPAASWNSSYRGELEHWTGGNFGPASTGNWDGDTFYLQFALKADSRRRDADINGGKIIYLTRSERALVAQQQVTTYHNENFAIFHAGSPGIISDLPYQSHIFDEWATYLYKIVPGDPNQPNSSVEVWRAIRGETTYTKLFEKLDHTSLFNSNYPKAWNALLCATFHNHFNMPEFFQRYDQIIFSKEYIPCPQAWA